MTELPPGLTWLFTLGLQEHTDKELGKMLKTVDMSLPGAVTKVRKIEEELKLRAFKRAMNQKHPKRIRIAEATPGYIDWLAKGH